jgi:radical SAM superfamily enzyme YgiQ (UPF0313 family)
MRSATYDFPPYRPPNEARSALIRVTRGCPWNQCAFCAMYKEIAFQRRPTEDILHDVDQASNVFPGRRTVFIADSDSLVHRDLVTILTAIRERLPLINRITSYARARTVARRSLEELKSLHRAGLTRLHVGLESGDPVVLERMRKGATPETMVESARKARAAGLELSVYVLCGAGGEDRWREHAQATAQVLSAMQPQFVRLRSLAILPGAPLYAEWKESRFHPVTPFTRLLETKKLIESLDPWEGVLLSDHISNAIWDGSGVVYGGVSGSLLADRDRMIAELSRALLEVGKRKDVYDVNLLSQMGHPVGL